MWSPPSDAVRAGGPPSCFAIPLMSRRGGLLVMVPNDFLDADLLLDAMQMEEEGLIGPSKDFTSGLVEEDDEGKVIPMGRVCQVLVLDLADEALLSMADYDPVTHDFESCASFDGIRPSALPMISDVMADVQSWLEGVTENRSHFYSAREEQEQPPKAPPKKGPTSKKITNVAIMENLNALQNQLQALQAQQDLLRGEKTSSSATPAIAPFTPMLATSKMPGVSANLAMPAGPLRSVAKLVGPPPKSKPPPAAFAPQKEVTGGGCGGADPADASSDPMIKAIAQQSQALTALVAHLAGGDPLTELQAIGSGAGGSLSSKGVARREKMQADLASRQSVQLFSPSTTTVVQTYAPEPSGSTYGIRTSGVRCHDDGLHGEAGRIQAQQGPSPLPMDRSSCDGLYMLGDDHGCREFLALLVTCLEQASYDGNWDAKTAQTDL